MALVLGALMPIAASVSAQAPTVVGVVRDSAGVPIASAEITIRGRRATSDSLGRFYLSAPSSDTMTVSVRRMGYESVSFTVAASDVAKNSLDVVLRRLAATLETVNVAELADRARTPLRGYDDRRARGLGVFVTRAEIEKRHTRLLSDVLRQSRGVMIRGGQVRFTNHQAKNCAPMIWLDGQQVPGLDLAAVPATDVEGVELYQSSSMTPSEFHRGNRQVECGTIVIWTKKPILEVKTRKP